VDVTKPMTEERLDEILRDARRRARTMGPSALPIYNEARELLREVERLRRCRDEQQRGYYHHSPLIQVVNSWTGRLDILREQAVKERAWLTVAQIDRLIEEAEEVQADASRLAFGSEP
jgi:hypothetical protein